MARKRKLLDIEEAAAAAAAAKLREQEEIAREEERARLREEEAAASFVPDEEVRHLTLPGESATHSTCSLSPLEGAGV